REVRVREGEEFANLEVGSEIKADVFSAGEYVDVIGVTKGKGFAGTIKRHNFKRGPMSHGSMYHRRVGSLGPQGPQRVIPGRRMPGRMGGERRTIQGLKVVRVDADHNLILVRGSVLGPRGSLVLIRETVKHKSRPMGFGGDVTMPKVSVYNQQGQPVGEIELSETVFGAEVNEALLHQAVVTYLANQRQGTASTKTRGEVRGGGRKPWRQKGLGRARHGSIRSPIWVGGGVVFGPKPRDYRLGMPKKARRAALRS